MIDFKNTATINVMGICVTNSVKTFFFSNHENLLKEMSVYHSDVNGSHYMYTFRPLMRTRFV